MLCRSLRYCAFFGAVCVFVSAPGGIARAGAAQAIAHYIMGVSFEFQEKPRLAFHAYLKSVQEYPSAFAAQMRLGIVASDLGENRQAVQAFTQAIGLRPDDLQSRYLLALAYSSLREYAKASAQFEIILKELSSVDPGNADIRMMLARIYYAQGKERSAVEQFENLLAVDPRSTAALLQVGSYYLDHGRRDEGRDLLKRCVGVDPCEADCLNALGYSYAEDGVELEAAGNLIKRALVVEPKNAAYRDSLGWIFFKRGQWNLALRYLQQAVVIDKDPAILDHIGDAYQRLGRMDRAVDAWRRAFVLDAGMTGLRLKIRNGINALRKP